MSDGEALFIVFDRDVPDDRARFGVERDQVRIQRGHEQTVAQNGEAAIRHDGAMRGDVG